MEEESLLKQAIDVLYESNKLLAQVVVFNTKLNIESNTKEKNNDR